MKGVWGNLLFAQEGVFPKACFVLLLLLTVSTWAAQVNLPQVTAAPGSEFDALVSVDNALGVKGYYFDIAYSSAILEYVGARQGGLTLAWAAPLENPRAGGVAVTGAAGAALASQTGSLVALRFRVKPSATPGQIANLQFLAAELNDGGVAVATNNGQVTVGAPAYLGVPTFTQGVTGQTVNVSIQAAQASSVQGYFVELAYDPAKMTYASVAKGALVTGWSGSPSANSSVAGKLIVAHAGAAVNPGAGGDLGVVSFTLPAAAGL